MQIEIQHSLARDEARSRLAALIEQLKGQYGKEIQDLKEEWTEYAGKIEGTAKGYSISGIVEVKDLVIDIQLKLPFMLKVFSGKIRSVVEDQVRRTVQ